MNEKGDEDIETARILISVGKVYSSLGDYKRAERRIKAAMKIVECINKFKRKYSC